MVKAVAALKAAGYEPYNQLYGYAMHGNDQYITRFDRAREIVTKMDVKDIKPSSSTTKTTSETFIMMNPKPWKMPMTHITF